MFNLLGKAHGDAWCGDENATSKGKPKVTNSRPHESTSSATSRSNIFDCLCNKSTAFATIARTACHAAQDADPTFPSDIASAATTLAVNPLPGTNRIFPCGIGLSNSILATYLILHLSIHSFQAVIPQRQFPPTGPRPCDYLSSPTDRDPYYGLTLHPFSIETRIPFLHVHVHFCARSLPCEAPFMFAEFTWVRMCVEAHLCLCDA